MHVRLMADYDCYPLWEGDGIANLDPRGLSISNELAAALTLWAHQYDATLNRDDPVASGFPDVSAAEAWLRSGVQLAARLRNEGIAVEYFHEDKRALDLLARR